jgi:hypothetical protein
MPDYTQTLFDGIRVASANFLDNERRNVQQKTGSLGFPPCLANLLP